MKTIRTPLVILTICALRLGLLTCAESAAGQAGTGPQALAFRGLGDAGKEQALNDLAAATAALPPDELVSVVAAGLADPSSSVRERALWAVARRAGRPGAVEVWRQERSTLRSMRAKVASLLADSDRQVRLAAIAALCGLDLDYDLKPGTPQTLSIATATALASQIGVEKLDQVRAHILNAFAWYAVPPAFDARRDAVFARAFGDPSSQVIQGAAFAVGKHRIAALLPRVVPLLTHDAKAVRVEAAQSVAAFGPQARAYLPDLERALDAETDEMARNALQGAINVIR